MALSALAHVRLRAREPGIETPPAERQANSELTSNAATHTHTHSHDNTYSRFDAYCMAPLAPEKRSRRRTSHGRQKSSPKMS